MLGARSERATATNTNALADAFNKNDKLTAKFKKAFKNVKKYREAVTNSYFLAQKRDKKIKNLKAKLAPPEGSESGENGRYYREYTPQFY